MLLGICSVPEEFQRLLTNFLEGLKNIEVIPNDIVVYGSGYTEQKTEHCMIKPFVYCWINACQKTEAKWEEAKIQTDKCSLEKTFQKSAV